MLRRSAVLTLLAVTTSGWAQTPPTVPPSATQAAPAPAKPATQQATATPTPPKPSATELNARVTAPLPPAEAAMKAHVMFLASDAMKGREAGSPEYDIAAQYVAAQFYAAGLRPGGDQGGYLQHVPLVSYRADGEGSFVWTGRGGRPTPLAFGTDYVPVPNPVKAETSVSAPVVFVGYGIDAPQYGQADYKGVDVRGKIVLFFGGVPSRFGSEEQAFFGSIRTKLEEAARRGAVGVIQIGGSRRPGMTAARLAQGYDRPRITWATAKGTGGAAGAPQLGTITREGAAKLFSLRDWARIVAEAEKPDPRFRPQPLNGTLTVASKTSFTPLQSSNVVGLLPGTDPALKDQVVILSAHLDHIGVGEPVNGDAINNGALDNAIGIASLIEEAKRFKAAGTAPKRTIMFLAVTAEEKGLVGSDYFANHPTVPLKNIVADVNLDMPILLYPFEDMVVFGAERSTIGPIVRRAVESAGVVLSPDPIPEQGIFVRSDHFRFVQKGVPSVFLWPGAKGPGKAAIDRFLSTNYHRPSDDLSQPILWDQGVRFIDVNYRIAREIADAPQRPVWNKGDYFGTLYKGPMAK
ncbi:M28 family metallopeptidase [Sphingomonas rubra]|uniref:Zn-dependent amino-or carboxypeptidase, M28 family n=1 Tax=Sphingomonas rubra TaxID=634430 RepID=A0A1I5TLH5_9SPHN|nr:M28 family metallopeptidase [Sphingomonas rubra]SFP83910.1 Zn-dependent amino-or carboxypeptidase, M28 family [Sphingomonas rubra]